jgi:hypothetical protein
MFSCHLSGLIYSVAQKLWKLNIYLIFFYKKEIKEGLSRIINNRFKVFERGIVNGGNV